VLFGAASDQTSAELAEHREIEAWVVQGQAQQILPIQTSANRVGGLPIREALGELQHRHQRQPPGRLRRPTVGGEQWCERFVRVNGAEFIAQPQPGIATWEGSASNASSLLRHRPDGLRMQ